MKRSIGVTAGAVSVILAGAAYCVYTVWWLTPVIHRRGFGFLIVLSIFQVAFAAWGIAAGTALLRLRPWARLSVLILSALIILLAIPELLGAPRLIRATTGIPTVSAGSFVSQEYFRLIGLGLIPCLLGIWWLAVFTRRGVRLQFVPEASAPGREGSFVPARSDAVTIAAIVLFVGSALLLLLALMTPLTLLIEPPSASPLPVRSLLIAGGVFYLLVAAWGVVTGVGVLRRRPWGRISMIVTGALGAAFSLLGSGGMMMGMMITSPDERLPAAAMHAAIAAAIAVMLIPLGISIWWLILFTRPRVALEFASPAIATVPPPLPSVAAQPELSPALSSSFATPGIPISIRIIAVVEILLAALALLGPLYSNLTEVKPPVLIFGFLVHGGGVVAFFVICGIAPIICCAAILRRKAWGLDALIVFLLAQIANLALIFVSPARVRFNAEIQTQMQSLTARMKMPDGSTPPSPIFANLNVFYDVTFAMSIVLYVVLLYFLITRHKAFRAACAAPAAGVPQ